MWIRGAVIEAVAESGLQRRSELHPSVGTVSSSLQDTSSSADFWCKHLRNVPTPYGAESRTE
ncbi:hypothetical protein CCMA1212_006231 [Trichoderma ghanense]|uniref:Uncharacterized protein n=1 Tax=Trichoderma ghanense TaxID=65468 RepID=A0ABY2H2M7_9HYPO